VLVFYFFKYKNMTNKHNFEAETGKVLELLTHSIYSNKEIFLRELVSNSADAIDKARLNSLTNPDYLEDDMEFKITIETDKDAKTIVITDNWVGMDEADLIAHLWTIAKSGTADFLEKLENKEHSLIWQFGVWFYSAFIITDKVEVETKKALEKKAYKWTSNWKTSYEIDSSDKAERWTKITLFVNKDSLEFLEDWKLKELVKKYSNYVWIPIMMRTYDSRTDEEKQKEPKVMDFEQVNETKAIWKKDKKDITTEEYKTFYQTISSDWNEPLFSLHTSTEGIVSYKSILFSPKAVNLYKDLTNPNLEFGPKLYIQNVLILENAKELLPIWLRFVTWVVETSDLPLNISREMLQSNSSLDKIKSGLVKKLINEFKKTLADNRKDYLDFFANYGKILKEWIHYEHDLKEQIAEICLFKWIKSSEFISLDEYLEKAPSKKIEDKEEKTIYYIIAKSENEALASPYLAQFREKNIDVLVLTDAIDSFLFQGFSEYRWVKLVSITSGDIELEEQNEEQKKQKEEKTKEFKSLLDFTKSVLWDDKIEEVVLNDKLTDSIWALKTPKNGVDPQLEKMMKAMGQEVPKQKRILELNPKNHLVSAMKTEFERDIKSEKLSEIITYAYNQAILLEWWEIEDIAGFLKTTNKFAGEYLK